MDFLLVEDNEMAVWIIRTNLERLGYRVDVAKTGLEALRLFHRGYDVILLDVCLPELNGLEVARIIRNKETKRNIILGISSLGDQIRDECLKAGFNDVYKKPTDMADLLKIIKRVQDVERTIDFTGSGRLSGGLPTTDSYQNKRRSLP
jgi:two-component system aerobic respiration control sensor histidine kinase ArcB